MSKRETLVRKRNLKESFTRKKMEMFPEAVCSIQTWLTVWRDSRRCRSRENFRVKNSVKITLNWRGGGVGEGRGRRGRGRRVRTHSWNAACLCCEVTVSAPGKPELWRLLPSASLSKTQTLCCSILSHSPPLCLDLSICLSFPLLPSCALTRDQLRTQRCRLHIFYSLHYYELSAPNSLSLHFQN